MTDDQNLSADRPEPGPTPGEPEPSTDTETIEDIERPPRAVETRGRRSGDRAVVVAAVAIVAAGALALGVVAVLRSGDDLGAGPPATPDPSLTTTTTAPAGPWVRRDSLRTARDDFGTVVVGDRIYITGGMTGPFGEKLDTTEIYDPQTDSWSMGASLPTARSSLGAAEIDGVIYTSGGSTLENAYLDIVEAYDSATQTWTRRAPLPIPRYEHAMVALGGKLYAIGGQTRDGPTGDVQVYDPATDSWSAGPPLSLARGSLRAVVWDGKIWAGGGNVVGSGPPVGGTRPGGEATATWEVFDPATQTWSAGPSMPAPLYNFGLAVFQGELHAIYHENHFVLGPGDTTWRQEDAPPIIRHGMGLIQLGDLMYSIGGCTKDPLVDVNSVQVYAGP